MTAAQQADDPLNYVPPHPDATRPEPAIECIQVEIDERAQRHADATREEPPEGQGREQWLKSRLKTFFREPVILQLVSREETATGPALSRFFTDYLDIRIAFAVGTLDEQELRMLWLQYGPDDLDIGDVARLLNLGISTVYRRRHYAIEYIGRIYYDEPDWVMPWRNGVRDEVRAEIADHLRDLGV